MVKAKNKINCCGNIFDVSDNGASVKFQTFEINPANSPFLLRQLIPSEGSVSIDGLLECSGYAHARIRRRWLHTHFSVHVQWPSLLYLNGFIVKKRNKLPSTSSRWFTQTCKETWRLSILSDGLLRLGELLKYIFPSLFPKQRCVHYRTALKMMKMGCLK